GIHLYDSDCNDLPSEQATLTANLSNHNSDVISEVPTYNTYHDNNVFEQNVQEMQDCEQQAFVYDSNDEFTSESNMISYEQYLKENESQVIHSTPSPTNQDSMIMSVIEQMSNQCSVDKKLFEIEKKELKLENERLLEHIICQDVMNIVMHADVKFDNVLPVPNTFLDDNISLDMIKMENDRLMELLVSQDLVHS
ncbi:hypothetical protein Tco_1543573, partial [Tanacetum coccineum]